MKRRALYPCSLVLITLTPLASAQVPELLTPAPSRPAPVSPQFLSIPAAPSSGWGGSDPPPGEPLLPQGRRRWYGWQNAIGFVASDLCVILGALAAASGKLDGIPIPTILLGGTGLAGQALASPIIHWAHGNVGTGFISFGLNGGLPMLGAGLGYLAGSADSSTAFAAFFVGFATGVAIGRTVDIAVLAYDTPRVSVGGDADDQRPVAFTLVPIVGRDWNGLGVGGAF